MIVDISWLTKRDTHEQGVSNHLKKFITYSVGNFMFRNLQIYIKFNFYPFML